MRAPRPGVNARSCRLQGVDAVLPKMPATAVGEVPDAADASARGTASELVLAFTAVFRWTP